MVEISEIDDEKSLKAWLIDWPKAQGWEEARAQQLSVWIAHRAAMRVLPVYWEWSLGSYARKRDLTALPILRLNLIGGVAVKCPTPPIKATAHSARSAAHSADSAALSARSATHSARSALSAALSAHSALSARSALSAALSAHSALSAALSALSAALSAHSALSAARSAAHSADSAARQDCTAVAERGGLPRDLPLWHDQDNPLDSAWATIKTTLQKRAETADWAFWLQWYQAALDGAPLNPEMLHDIALIEPGVWEGEPEDANRAIQEIVAEFAAAGSFNAEELIRDPRDGLVESVPISDLEDDDLRDARDRMRDAIATIRNLPTAGNMCLADILSAEISQIETFLDKYADRPLRLYEVCIDAILSVDAKIADAQLPEHSEEVTAFQRQLDRSATDILANDPQVESKIKRRGSVRFARMNAAEMQRLQSVTRDFAKEAKPELADELADDLRVATTADDTVTQQERDDSRYQLGSRIVGFARLRTGEAANTADAAGKAVRGVKSVAEATEYAYVWVQSWFI